MDLHNLIVRIGFTLNVTVGIVLRVAVVANLAVTDRVSLVVRAAAFAMVTGEGAFIVLRRRTIGPHDIALGAIATPTAIVRQGDVIFATVHGELQVAIEIRHEHVSVLLRVPDAVDTGTHKACIAVRRGEPSGLKSGCQAADVAIDATVELLVGPDHSATIDCSRGVLNDRQTKVRTGIDAGRMVNPSIALVSESHARVRAGLVCVDNSLSIRQDLNLNRLGGKLNRVAYLGDSVLPSQLLLSEELQEIATRTGPSHDATHGFRAALKIADLSGMALRDLRG